MVCLFVEKAWELQEFKERLITNPVELCHCGKETFRELKQLLRTFTCQSKMGMGNRNRTFELLLNKCSMSVIILVTSGLVLHWWIWMPLEFSCYQCYLSGFAVPEIIFRSFSKNKTKRGRKKKDFNEVNILLHPRWSFPYIFWIPCRSSKTLR